jgi:hypothetical protein
VYGHRDEEQHCSHNQHEPKMSPIYLHLRQSPPLFAEGRLGPADGVQRRSQFWSLQRQRVDCLLRIARITARAHSEILGERAHPRIVREVN